MSSRVRAAGLCHGGRTGAATGLRLQLDGGLGLGLILEKSADVGSGLEMGRAGAGGSSPTCPTDIMSQTITRSTDLTPLSGSALMAADGSFGLVGCEWLAGLISKVKELQEEKVTLEARLTQLCGGVYATAVDKGAVVSVMEKEDKLLESRREMECLVLDTVRLQRVLDNIRTSALQLKARYDVERVIRFQLEAGIAAMKKDIEMTSRVHLKLEAKRAQLWKELCFITKVLQEKKTQRGSLALLPPLLSTELTAACRRKLQTLLIQLHNLISVNRSLRRSLAEARSRATSIASRYEAQIAGLEAAIEAAKCDLHEEIMSHKELLDMKLALGAEIATYWSLLDGEELSFPIQASRSSSPLYLSESPPASTRSSSPLNPVEADITVEARSECWSQ
ncbi:desmin-like isoform X2 [Colossoma macropomum]|uniref:desmin-like isoform X2 n=1 Tax=Colossoma macropomum TaxID=42526 RepID=UPI0018649E31|nr:desmin-like isoform X2 [Colossoma macropomum]